MAWLFVRLKLRLLRNGARDTARVVGLVVGTLVGLLAGIGGLAALTALPGGGTGRAVLVWGATAAVVWWTVTPLITFGADETLDPSRLALLPLTRRQLVTGLFAASATGIAPLATALALGGLVGFAVHHSSSAAPAAAAVAVLLAALAAAALWVLCLSLSRAVSTALARFLRSRRGRDLSTLIGALIGAAFYATRFLVLPAGQGRTVSGTVAAAAPATAVLSWTPPGWAGQVPLAALDGHWLRAAGGVAVLLAADALVLWWWQSNVSAALVTVDASTVQPDKSGREKPHRLLFPGWLSWLPRRRWSAVLARELLYSWREPRRRSQWIGTLLFSSIIVVGTAVSNHPGGRPGGGLVLAACLPGGFAALSALNQFGTEGRALWLHVAAGGDPRADFAGRNGAAAMTVLPYTAVFAAVLAAYTGGWRLLPAALGLAVGVLAAGFGVANAVTGRLSFPLPENPTNPFAGGGTGRGCSFALANLAAMLALALICLPLIVLAALATGRPLAGWLLVAAGPAYGALVWWLGVRRGAADFARRGPEILAAVSPSRVG